MVRTGQLVGLTQPVPVPQGFLQSECTIVVSIEDDHPGPAYTNQFNFDTNWADYDDDEYGGSQSFAQSAGAFQWNVTCQYGYKNGNALTWPIWTPAACRYLIICKH